MELKASLTTVSQPFRHPLLNFFNLLITYGSQSHVTGELCISLAKPPSGGNGQQVNSTGENDQRQGPQRLWPRAQFKTLEH